MSMVHVGHVNGENETGSVRGKKPKGHSWGEGQEVSVLSKQGKVAGAPGRGSVFAAEAAAWRPQAEGAAPARTSS